MSVILGIQHASIHLIFVTTLGADHYSHRFTDEEIEAHRAKVFAPDTQSVKGIAIFFKLILERVMEGERGRPKKKKTPSQFIDPFIYALTG